MWDRLLSAGSLAEQYRMLASTSYAPWVQRNGESTRATIEHALQRTVRKIERSLAPQAARFIRLWGRRDVVRNLKTILKGKVLARSEAEIRGDLVAIEPPEVLPTEALLRCPDPESVLDLLETTEWRHWIRAARRIYRRDPTLFGLDAALDRFYYPELWQQVQRLHAWDQTMVDELVSLEIDQVNLLWLLRYRLNYRLSPAETYYLLVPVTGRLASDELKELVRPDSLERILVRITVQPFQSILARCESVSQAELLLWRYRARHAEQMLARAGFTLAEALALLVLIEIEIRDLTAVLEGTKLGRPRREIEEQLASSRSRGRR
jgi:V/A-type H+-transporting ATPase subunit C